MASLTNQIRDLLANISVSFLCAGPVYTFLLILFLLQIHDKNLIEQELTQLANHSQSNLAYTLKPYC